MQTWRTWFLSLFCLQKSKSLVHALVRIWKEDKIKINKFEGISLKSQILYCIVFLTRYIDVVYKYHSLYNTCMKIFFLGSSFYTVYLMTFKFKATYDKSLDTFKVEYLLLFAAVFSLVFCYDYKVTEVSRWTTWQQVDINTEYL